MIGRLEKSISKLALYNAIYKIKKNGFWFIDIPRTSSSSIKIELSNVHGPIYGKSNLIDKGYGKKSYFKDHLTAQEVKSIFKEDLWNKLFTFTIVRNPWDRMLSLYFYRLLKGQLPSDLDFRDYIIQLKSPRYKLAKSMHSRPTYYYGSAEYILDEKDNVIVDFIGKYENREEALQVISKRIDCPMHGELCLQKAKPSDSHYSRFYDNETRKLVADVFAKDIELFGYEFEDLS
ncbi:MAG: sulfotransferase family 2 domain-containing protein [Calditrichia bacterium]|nr:sulfotransferase family 2 domain-containing protein [Calditrichia bacterium]